MAVLIDIRALNAYSSRVRRKFLAKVTSLGWDEATKNREASYHSLMGILLHMIDNEYWIVNIVIPGRPAMERTKHPLSDFAGFDSVESFLAGVEDKTRSYLGGLDSNELSRVVKFTLSSGAVFDMTVEECLFQSFTEQLYHLGEMIALLWQDDIEPPTMQWFSNRESLTLSP